MTIQRAGTELSYTITFLEMTQRPEFPYPVMPVTCPGTLLCAKEAPVWYFLSLYDAVGRDYAWEDIHQREHDDLQSWLSKDGSELYTLMAHGFPQGFFILDQTAPDICDIAYFGLVPEAVGSGLGKFLIQTAILTGWDREGVEKMTINTCTLDHPRALALYQKSGFTPVRREDRTRVLKRDRDLSRIPK